jgi:hypothetical protein
VPVGIGERTEPWLSAASRAGVSARSDSSSGTSALSSNVLRSRASLRMAPVVVAATRKSQANASSKPPPNATPRTTATVGIFSISMAR